MTVIYTAICLRPPFDISVVSAAYDPEVVLSEVREKLPVSGELSFAKNIYSFQSYPDPGLISTFWLFLLEVPLSLPDIGPAPRVLGEALDPLTAEEIVFLTAPISSPHPPAITTTERVHYLLSVRRTRWRDWFSKVLRDCADWTGRELRDAFEKGILEDSYPMKDIK